MFSRSISPLLTPQHLQNSSMPCWSLWSSTIQRLTDTTTQQWHNTHLLSYTSTLMRFKEKEALVSYSQNIHIPEGTSVSSNKFTKKEVWKFLGFLLLLCLAPQFFSNRSSTIRQTQRKITSIAKLPSIELLTMLPKISPPPLLQNNLPDPFFLELPSFLPKASSPNRLVFSFTLPNRHFIITAPT